MQLFSGVVTRVVLPHQVVWTLHLEAVPMRAALYEVVRVVVCVEVLSLYYRVRFTRIIRVTVVRLARLRCGRAPSCVF